MSPTASSAGAVPGVAQLSGSPAVPESSSALDAWESRARERLRAARVDPVADPIALGRIVAEVLDEHDRRSLTGVVAPVGDPDRAGRVLQARLSGFGALQPYLDDDTVEEIWINAPDRVFVARAGRHQLTSTVMSREEVSLIVERMLAVTGRRLDISQPFVDARLPGGHRLHVVREGVSAGFAAVNIRKFLHRRSRLADLVDLGALTAAAAEFLGAAVGAGATILIAGATQAGKTTMLNCLAAGIGGHERIISVEEVRELAVAHPDWVALEGRQAGLEGTGAVTLRDLVRESLRMRPTRLLIGEVRGAEALDLLVALNSGLPAMATLHANSAMAALTKLTTLPMMAGENITADFVIPTVAATVDLVVHLAVTPQGRRQVTEIASLTGRVEGGVLEHEVLFRSGPTGLARTTSLPSRRELYDRAGVDLVALLRDR